MKNKILFIGDLYRGAQADNVACIHRLFSPVFKQLEIVTSIYVSDVNRERHLKKWLEGWKKSLAGNCSTSLEEINLDDTAVVGFEVPECDLLSLNKRGVPWVNFAIHPIRFLDDLYFDVSTSFDCDLQTHAAGRGLIDLCVNVLRTKYTAKVHAEQPSTLAIFGQTTFDKSVYFDGNFYTLKDYLPKLDRLVADHDRVLFRPHPYKTDSEMDNLIYERYGATPCIGQDFYEELMNSGITTACAISSSVITEAPYFGINALYLDTRAKVFGPPISYRSLLDDQIFWAKNFLGRAVPSHRELISPAVPDNYLRSTFTSWGYVTREQEIEMRLQQTEAKVEQTEASLLSVLNSRSWKITAPLRGLNNFFRKSDDH